MRDWGHCENTYPFVPLWHVVLINHHAGEEAKQSVGLFATEHLARLPKAAPRMAV
jgi:hypothetical protein